METDEAAAWVERFSPEVLGFIQIAIDQLDFEFDFCGAAIARELEECVRGFVRETLNEVFLRKFGLWMVGSEFTGNRRYTLQNQQQSPVREFPQGA
ncbi:uncharacterized protein LOC104446632 [Eucalyptus grandis]|uniref:uncharacterized protein LOC104446632 n=1 Tax=Eucalyptus grandis TaxID=71139 RepID=UPI00192F02E2|nr:uncharacterized protein LOC104446632 [Eucalyptus grandis]